MLKKNTETPSFYSEKVGGLGFDIALRIKNEGKKIKLITFLGGYNGYWIKEQFRKMGIKTKHVRTLAESPLKISQNNTDEVYQYGNPSRENWEDLKKSVRQCSKNVEKMILVLCNLTKDHLAFSSDIEKIAQDLSVPLEKVI